MFAIVNSSYGKAFKAIREDEIAAESMGIDLFKHKVMAFVIGAFFAGVGGGLLASLQGAVNPLMFRFVLTFNVVLVIVLGGMGSMTGSVISAFVVTSGLETLRVLDESIRIGPINMAGIPGLRMVVFSTMLMIVVIFFQNGLMGTKELSWQRIIDFFTRRSSKKEVSSK
jgi:branched-chain amino acid transport system permease protein